MKEKEPSLDEMIEGLRKHFGNYLKIARSMLLGEPVDKESRELVEELSSDDKWFYQHCVSPCDFLGVEPDEEMASALKIYEDDDDGDDENDDEAEDELGDEDEEDEDEFHSDHFGRTKEMTEFGIKNDYTNEDDFKLAKALWEGESVTDVRTWGVCSFDSAMRILLDAKVNTFGDFEKYVGVAERIISTYDGDAGDLKYARWKLADSYYILGRYDKALAIYQTLLSKEKSIVTRPPLASQILNIKMRAGLKVEAKDLMMLTQPSDYNITFAVYNSLLTKANEYLTLILDGMVSRGLDLPKVIADSYDDEHPFSCFYRAMYVQKMLKKEGKDFQFPYISPETGSLREILDTLFDEMKFLGQQLRDIDGIQDDWVEDVKLYNRLAEAFPREEIVHHYRSSWMWKYQLSVYFPRLNFALDYRGERVQCAKNYTRQSGGKDEYIRLYDRTMKKATDKYGIEVEVVDVDTTFESIVSIVESHGALAVKSSCHECESSDSVVEMQRIICPTCGNELEAPTGLVEGQHLLCPFCNEKFSYHE